VLLLDVPFFAAATASVCSFYVASQREVGATAWQRVKYLPLLMAIGIGLSVNNSRAVIEAVLGQQSSFTRTPKLGVVRGPGDIAAAARRRYKAAVTLQPLVELGLAAYMTYGIAFVLDTKVYYSLPFLFLFQAGFGYVGLMSLLEGARDLWARLGVNAEPQPGVD
jgi:hypothetical protein